MSLRHYKISDILLQIKNIELRFNSIFFYNATSRSGNPYTSYFHKEYTINNEKETISRKCNYHVSIEEKDDRGNKISYMRLFHGDFYQFRFALERMVDADSGEKLILNTTEDVIISITRLSTGIKIAFGTMIIELSNVDIISFLAVLKDMNLLNLWNHHATYIGSSKLVGDDKLKYNFSQQTNYVPDIQTNSGKITKKYTGKKSSFFS